MNFSTSNEEVLTMANDLSDPRFDGMIEAYRRRQFLGNAFTGLAGVGLAALLANDATAEGTTGLKNPPPAAHFPPKAKRVLQIFCPGAASRG